MDSSQITREIGRQECQRVLFLAQLPPPVHGVTVVSRRIFGMLSETGRFEIERLWAGGARTTEDIGTKNLAKILELAGLVATLVWRLVRRCRYDFAYLTLTPWSHAAIRDAVLARLSLMLARRTLVLYALNATGIRVVGNFIRNVRGPAPRGQAVQFDKVSGPGNRVICNVIVNQPGKSDPEDAINMFRSRGTGTSPIIIRGNKVLGGGPSLSGGGILVGDYGGSNIHVSDNRLVDPGQYGVAIAGGSQMKLLDNKIVARRQSFTNVGLYVRKGDREGEPCHSNEVKGNNVSYINAKGEKNPAYDAGTCGAVAGFEESNIWNAELEEAIVFEKDLFCRQW